jgi:RNA polymerase sigma factor (sigma-70 family)
MTIMGRGSTPAGWKDIETLFEAGSMVGLTDRQLLDRFLAGESAETAFEALVNRHGPVVRSVCRSMLRDPHEADDAFQATFLVLARRASAIRRRDAVGSWLYGVACRVAAHARGDAARRRLLVRYLAEQAAHEPPTVRQPNELVPEVLEEVERLPERYRAPIVLCYLEGQSQEQAARLLGCPLRTVQTRLQRAKARLRDRLIQRGLAPAAGLLAIGVESAEAATAVLMSAVPAALSETTARASVQFAATRTVGLGSTARVLAQGVLRALFWNQLRRAAGMTVGLTVAAALTFFAITAAGQKADKPVATITGRILDDQGRPIAGAEVWMPITFEETPETTPHATTDNQGRYALPVPEGSSKLPISRRHWIVWAHAPGHRIATARAQDPLLGQKGPVDLTLGSASDTGFRVLGPDGRPVAGAVVEPFHFKTQRAYDILPKAMSPAVRAVTDASGRARLPAIPREGFFTVKVSGEAVGSQQLRLRDQATEPAEREIRLRPVGRIEGRVVANRPELARGITVYMSTTDPSGQGAMGLDRTEGDAVVTTGPDGSFVVPAIAAGKLTVGMRVDQALSVRPRIPVDLDIPLGRTTRVDIPLDKAVRVVGVIRVKGSGDPVPSAEISIGYGASRQHDSVVSDGQGRFTAHVLAGNVTMQVISMNESFVQLGQPWAERYQVPKGAEAFDLPPIEVVRAVEIKGRLVDAENRPMANVGISGLSGNRRYGFGRTDQAGSFTLSQVPADLDLGYQFSRNDHEGPRAAEIVTKEPLLLRAGTTTRPSGANPTAVGIRGRVIDENGRPVEGAGITLAIEANDTLRQESLTTDSAGDYQDLNPIVKGTTYWSIVTPGKFAIAASEPVTAKTTDPIVLPPIRVARLRTIVGRVVDTEGRPVAGAHVLNWGNPTPLTDAVTGPSGRFQLDGFSRERAWLFVDAPGFRFHRASPDPGKSTTELTIRRVDQPPERGVASLGPPIPHDRALHLAATILEPYAARIIRPGTDANARARALEVAARIDPAGAWRKCQAGEALWDSNPVRIAAVRHFINTNPTDAESILPTITNEFWRQSLRIELADSLPATARDRKLGLLDDVIEDALKPDGKGLHIYHLKEGISRLIDLGRREEAQRLLNEVLPLAKKADAGDRRMQQTRGLIGCLARLDLAAALALIPTQGDERTINDLRGLIAQSIAIQHPDEAERLLSQMTWNCSETYIVKACRRMAQVDLPRARRINSRIKIEALRGYALGAMAENISVSDRATALDLRAESFEMFRRAMEQGMVGLWGVRSASVMAAALLPGIERTDPDCLAEAVDRVLSLSWSPRSVRDFTMMRPGLGDDHAMQTNAALAAALARYDHDLARSIARPIIERLKAPLSRAESQQLDRYAVLPPLALADPEATAALVEVIPDLKEEGIGQSRDIVRLIVAGALAEPEFRFWMIMRRAVSDLEMVERDD